MSFSTKTALIADDDEFFRVSLRGLLASTLGFSDVIEAENLEHATTLLSEKEIDLAVFDLVMPGMAGPGSLKGVRDRFPDLCLVMASLSDRREDILSALDAGVNGYIPKNIGLKEFSSALRQILEGRVYVPPSIASRTVNGWTNEIGTPAASELAATLTARQKDVLALLVKGNSNKEIARELGLGEGTVKVHLGSLFRLLGVHSRSAAAVKGAAIVSENGGVLH